MQAEVGSGRVRLSKSDLVHCAIQDELTKRLSVIVSCYNEQNTVAELLIRVRAALPFSQIIVVDDGSTDESHWRISQVASKLCLEVMRLPANRGKGAAVRHGLEFVNREYAIVQDSDLEYDPQDIANLLRFAIENNLPVVYGSRYLLSGRQSGGRLVNYLAVKLLSAVVAIRFSVRLSDPATCYKLMPTELWRELGVRRDGFEYCQYTNVQLLARKISIRELPISYRPRSYRQGKKIGIRDFLPCVMALMRPRGRVEFLQSKPIELFRTCRPVDGRSVAQLNGHHAHEP